jgi:S-adenosylmethionine decarboxylase
MLPEIGAPVPALCRSSARAAVFRPLPAPGRTPERRRRRAKKFIFFLQCLFGGHTLKKLRAEIFRSKKRKGEGKKRLHALGRHLLLELFDCDAEAINSLETVKTSMVEAAKRAQATIVDVVFHEFNPFGISGVVVIAESHLAIHTWPEYRYAAVDVFSCGDVLQPQVAADYLVEQLGATRASVVELQRGVFMTQGGPLPHKPVAIPG